MIKPKTKSDPKYLESVEEETLRMAAVICYEEHDRFMLNAIRREYRRRMDKRLEEMDQPVALVKSLKKKARSRQ